MISDQKLITSCMLTILFFNLSFSYVAAQSDDLAQIYGVRWFLGDRFAYSHQELAGNNYYTLAFNTDEGFIDDVYVQISETTYSCTNRHLQVQHVPGHENNNLEEENITVVHIYRCNINQNLYEIGLSQIQDYEGDGSDLQTVEILYTIYTSSPVFDRAPDQIVDGKNHVKRDVSESKRILYQETFRPLPTSRKNKLGFVALGDWAQIESNNEQTISIMPYLSQYINDHPQINMVLFLGDIAYDFLGQKYYSMLDYIQPLTSRVCFMATPGNHQYVYHEDSFELFAQTFLSPEWNKYYNFYYTMVLGDLMFVQYAPQNILYQQKFVIDISPADYMIPDLYLNSTQPNKLEVKNIKDSYHVIAFSHYPIFCSEMFQGRKSCQNTQNIMEKYLKIFSDIGLDLYISAHLHLYERSHEICFPKIQQLDHDLHHEVIQPNSNNQQNGDIYQGSCPIHVIDGVAGCSFMANQQLMENKQFRANLSFGTGFGVLLYHPDQQQLSYTHLKLISQSQSIQVDKFTKKLQRISIADEKQDSAQKQNIITIQIGIILFLMILFSFLCHCFICNRQNAHNKEELNRLKPDNNEMIQENFQTIRSDTEQNKEKRQDYNHLQQNS